MVDHAEISRRTSEALRALSHEHRLQILSVLGTGERSVGDLEKLLDLAQPAVSHQLARLRLDDLVAARRDGRTIYYRLCTERIQGILGDLAMVLGYEIVAPTEVAGETAEAAAADFGAIEDEAPLRMVSG